MSASSDHGEDTLLILARIALEEMAKAEVGYQVRDRLRNTYLLQSHSESPDSVH